MESLIKPKILKRYRIPANSRAVEKCFNSIGFIVNERRIYLQLNQINSTIVLHSTENLKK